MTAGITLQPHVVSGGGWFDLKRPCSRVWISARGGGSLARMKATTATTKPVDKLTDAQAKAELERLAREIAHHDELYYAQDAPEDPDADYHALRQRHAATETAFP